ncbi:uncharacterized protein LOC130537016 [Takifugu flavidus]|uniref:uncharacterized protein LOC130537016 n=1 Tax=Takifugu flavidus TaxID=433684 RepID=UPI002544232E|nr:uncharacterized protein LOC130537016 [Takifugu flavidus]
MILTGRTLCLPSPATVQELFLVARDASILPDISLDPVLTTFLSPDSSAALQHQYGFLRRSMSSEQQAAFTQNLTQRLGGSRRVTYGGVGVVALALSLIFDQVSQQIRGIDRTTGSPQRAEAQVIFGISSSSRIGWIIHRYLQLIPGLANDEEKMAETTEIFDELLNLELLDHYERMTTKKRMSTEAMQQWLTGAAFHMHMRIHQVRLNSMPVGAAESLRRSCKSELNQLIVDYKVYLRRNIRETAAPRPRKRRNRQSGVLRQSSTFNQTSLTWSGPNLIAASSAAGKINEPTASNAAANIGRKCKIEVLSDSSGGNVTEVDDKSAVGTEKRKRLSNSSGINSSAMGLLVIEPLRNVSHSVQHHQCESPAIQHALVSRIMDALDMEQNKHFFQYPEKVLYSLLRQEDDFEL